MNVLKRIFSGLVLVASVVIMWAAYDEWSVGALKWSWAIFIGASALSMALRELRITLGLTISREAY